MTKCSWCGVAFRVKVWVRTADRVRNVVDVQVSFSRVLGTVWSVGLARMVLMVRVKVVGLGSQG